MTETRFTMRPIGTAHTPFASASQVPRGHGATHTAEGVLEIRADLAAGLDDVEGFSHLYVVWVFDRSDGYDLHVTPPTDTRPHGVFATHSPRRPNPIAITTVRLLGRDGARLRVSGVDMLDETPILDIRPCTSSVPAAELRRGWLADAERERRGD